MIDYIYIYIPPPSLNSSTTELLLRRPTSKRGGDGSPAPRTALTAPPSPSCTCIGAYVSIYCNFKIIILYSIFNLRYVLYYIHVVPVSRYYLLLKQVRTYMYLCRGRDNIYRGI